MADAKKNIMLFGMPAFGCAAEKDHEEFALH